MKTLEIFQNSKGTILEVAQDDQSNFVVRIKLSKPEARGEIVLTEYVYGVDVSTPPPDAESVKNPEWCPEMGWSLGMFDMYYKSEACVGSGRRPPIQFVFNSPGQTEDAVGFVRYYPDGTEVDFTRGVKQIKTGEIWERVYGYPKL